MNDHDYSNMRIAAPGSSTRGLLLRLLLPVFVVAYAALPLAVARHSR